MISHDKRFRRKICFQIIKKINKILNALKIMFGKSHVYNLLFNLFIILLLTYTLKNNMPANLKLKCSKFIKI